MKLAVIPARGGSKRIPRKNVKLFSGKPMLSYAISVAKESGLFDAIVVSSDDKEILLLAEELGVKPLKRPEELANDIAPTVPVIAHAIDVCISWGLDPQSVCCIYPTVPFLQAQTLVEAYSLFNQKEVDYIFPVVAFPSPIARALSVGADGKVNPINENYIESRSQDFNEAYYDAGQFYWGRKSAWMEGKNIHAHSHAFVVPHWWAIDINTPDDWVMAERLFKANTIQ